ncbi:MAG: alpha-hydroxy acid oxidase [Rhodomicrobium sp.]
MDFNRRDLLLSGVAVGTTFAAAAAAEPVSPQEPATRASAAATDHPVPSSEGRIKIITLRDLEADAQKVLPAYSQAYIAGGAGDEWSMRENEAAINRWIIEPDFLSGNLRADPAATLFGSKIAAPVIAAPIASHTLFHTAGEAATAKGTDQAGSIFVSSSASTLDLETIAASSPGPKWFQIYLPVDRGFARELLQRAKAAGYKVIVITVDATVISNRERVMRVIGSATPNLGGGNKPRTPGVDPIAAAAWKRDLTWDDVAFCGTESGLPVVVKSIITLKNVKQAMAHGCAGVWISNHGGRQLDNVAAPMDVLPRVVEAVDGRGPIIVDGGIRRGQDVFRALALGASAVSIGRPLMYGLALGGAGGVQSVFQHLKNELEMVMQLSGTPTVKAITRGCVSPHLVS